METTQDGADRPRDRATGSFEERLARLRATRAPGRSDAEPRTPLPLATGAPPVLDLDAPLALPMRPEPSPLAGPDDAPAPERLADDGPRRVADDRQRETIHIGHVSAIDGCRAVIAATADPYGENDACAVGKLVTVEARHSRVIGLVSSNAAGVADGGAPSSARASVTIELLGELRASAWHGRTVFDRGISSYPRIGARATSVTSADLETIYNNVNRRTIEVGTLLQDESIKATVGIDGLLEKHFAVLGTTGAGKSTAVSLIAHAALDISNDLRVLLIDPHNEYRHAFADRAEVLSPTNICLPFWLFNFEETCDVIFRGRPAVEEEVDILADMIPVAKARFMQAQDRASARPRRDADPFGLSVDTPIPYRISDLLGLIDTEMGKLDSKVERPRLKRLKARIESVAQDPRYQFMFQNLTIEDSMDQILKTIFRVPQDGKPVTILELAGFPSEVTQPVVSVLARMAFDLGLWSNGALPLLFICEEAHRYIPADHRPAFAPVVRAVSRIAKEGRKYNVHLGVVSQRPSELNATVLALCSTVFAMRLTNEHDHAIVRSAVSDAAASMLSFLPSIGNREAIAFGEGVTIAMRLRFRDLDEARQPKSVLNGVDRQSMFQATTADEMISEVIRNWRSIERRSRA